ncbi:MAG: PAS domain-containing protein [Nitrospirae bacterium]|nr:PAS domain-containing protein [Nitrospirota bacterium]
MKYIETGEGHHGKHKVLIRILSGFIIFLLMMFLLVSIGINNMNENYKLFSDVINHRDLEIQIAEDMRFLVRHEAVIVRNIIVNKISKDVEIKRYNNAIKEYDNSKNKLIKMIEKANRSEDRDVNNSVKEILDEISRDEKTTLLLWDKAIKLSENGDIQAAYNLLVSDVRSVQWKWLDNVDKIVELERKDAREDYEKFLDRYNKSKIKMIILGIVTLIIGTIISMLTTMSISKPLKNLIKSQTIVLEEANRQLNQEVVVGKKLAGELQSSLNELTLAKHFMENVSNGITDEIILLSKDFKILWANNAVLQNRASTVNEIIGMSCYNLTHHSDVSCNSPDDPCPVKEFYRTGQPTPVTHVHHKANGSISFVEVEAYPILDHRGEINEFVYVSKDITERVKREEDIRNLNKILEQKLKEETSLREQKEQLLIQQSKLAEMGDMIGAIAHQWKQPLTSISLIANEIEDAYEYGEMTGEYMKDCVIKILDQTKFMSKTIEDFRNFMKPSKVMSDFDIKEVIDDVLFMFEAMLRKSNVDVLFEKDISSERYITTGYPNEFKHVVLNLINNSRDAICSIREKNLLSKDIRGKITLNLSSKDDKILLTISDNGGGVPYEIISKIFDPYFTTKPDEKGTGIGLYISKKIIENINGSLACKNVEDGAEFTITINKPQRS